MKGCSRTEDEKHSGGLPLTEDETGGDLASENNTTCSYSIVCLCENPRGQGSVGVDLLSQVWTAFHHTNYCSSGAVFKLIAARQSCDTPENCHRNQESETAAVYLFVRLCCSLTCSKLTGTTVGEPGTRSTNTGLKMDQDITETDVQKPLLSPSLTFFTLQ